VQQRFSKVGASTQATAEPAGTRQGGKSAFASGAASPRKRGVLARGYEDRFSSVTMLEQDSTCPPSTPRPSRKPGVTTFSDPMNPFARGLSKHITRMEEARNDTARAGSRTRNPGIIPRDACVERSLSEDGRHPLVALRYSTTADWRPSKRCPDHVPVGAEPLPVAPLPVSTPRSPRCSEAFTSTLPERKQASGSVLENYLNDMKRCRAALRSVPPTASALTQRLNDERVKLPAERRAERFELLGGSSCEQPEQLESARIRRSVSCDSRFQRNELSDKEDNYGFIRKREVSGTWTTSRRDLLHHSPGHDDPPSTPRTRERLTRKADDRLNEIVAHMKAVNPEQRMQFEHYKARAEQSAGLIMHDSTPC
jgi:hypothetical protein